ncbi:MAG: V-type ATP synthase subunit D [Blastococcus sp.]
MTAFHGVPAGRAGRTWLRTRLATARRGVELLESKLRVLQREQQRFHLRAERAAAEWQSSCREAESWLLRAVLLGGQRALTAAVPDGLADVEVAWTVAMGVRHPREAVVRSAAPAPTAATPGNTALVVAADAYRAALAAGATHAVVAEAVRRIDAEVLATRRRLRAVQDRWIPRLAEALHDVEAGLEELELAEGGRLRWAARRAREAGES